ncbi:DUF6249 domain-containing protein [Dysgonomonas sp. 511]|uniref:DUF6249 domain-containing protein n=1 Tax=Dysgonomonas sp. 511 TaxID=2302930 RepID=UPI0013D5ADB2|nr:DUF6249 domain-containing protein [Dysgonomonas sp. 511]NDV77606.1 hypothetical protein [Dysgonomonas sp. 511]
MVNLIPMVVSVAFFYFTYKIFELIVRRKERMAMIEKMSEGFNFSALGDMKSVPFFRTESGGSWTIRIGLLLLGIGLGVTIASVVDMVATPSLILEKKQYHDFRNAIAVLYLACASVFGGVGLVTAYFIERRKAK